MDISLAWLNRYLDPAGVTADEADHLLTEAGFPIEGRTPLPSGDVVLDVEVTSNRGDCLSHVGCAREIAAAASARGIPRRLALPPVHDPEPGKPIGADLTLDNQAHDACPRFTARLIRNVKIGPSPKWLVDALESVGARSINNVVDVTNFITFELGNPCHVFDHAKLAGGALVVRHARAGERIKTLYEGEHKLEPTDVVVADAQRPQSLAGVIGGFDSQVDQNTTTVAFEMATWTPAVVRAMSRRMNIRTDAAHRFERRIDARTIDDAARRAVALICELTGGELAGGVLDQGPALPAPAVIDLRPSRADLVIGVPTGRDEIVKLLEPLGIACEPAGGDLIRCTIPAHRASDLTREIDLIEEVARTRSLGVVPIRETLPVRVHRPQPSEQVAREIAGVLTAQGAYETVTFSFTTPARAKLFLPEGQDLVEVDDERRKAEPTLRPSTLCGLLECRRANRDAQVAPPGGVRLFETSAVFAQRGGQSTEHPALGVVFDVPGAGKKRSPEEIQHAVRAVRGAIDAVVRACAGPEARVVVTPAAPDCSGWDAGAHATVELRTPGAPARAFGRFGVISAAALKAFDLDLPHVGAELVLGPLVDAYPPTSLAHELPRFPGIDRDLSVIVDEKVSWAQVSGLVESSALERLVGHELVAVYRGKQAGDGRKSVTVRLFFRDPERTLRREEVEPAVERLAGAARERLGAEIRA